MERERVSKLEVCIWIVLLCLVLVLPTVFIVTSGPYEGKDLYFILGVITIGTLLAYVALLVQQRASSWRGSQGQAWIERSATEQVYRVQHWDALVNECAQRCGSAYETVLRFSVIKVLSQMNIVNRIPESINDDLHRFETRLPVAKGALAQLMIAYPRHESALPPAEVQERLTALKREITGLEQRIPVLRHYKDMWVAPRRTRSA
jgi:hypothetical protein